MKKAHKTSKNKKYIKVRIVTYPQRKPPQALDFTHIFGRVFGNRQQKKMTLQRENRKCKKDVPQLRI